MTINEIKEKRKNLISLSNPEWQRILRLRTMVQKDFHERHYLTGSSFGEILEWKLTNQIQRIEKIVGNSPDSLINSITECFHKIDHPDDEMKTRIKVQVLLSIPWIGVGIASTIMSLYEPQFYGSIDQRSWSVLYKKEKKSFSGNDYLHYLRSVRGIASKAGCNVAEIDYILWKQYDEGLAI